MAILHDLAESIIGDYLPNEIGRKRKRELERNAMELILQSIPRLIPLKIQKDLAGICAK